MQKLVQTLEPLWDHNLGRSTLGTIAFRAGLSADAKRILEMHFEKNGPDVCISKYSRVLVWIWHGEGQLDRVEKFLGESSEIIKKEIQEWADEPDYVVDLEENLKLNPALHKELFEGKDGS
ncbi:MAG: hypothetical protein AAF483_16810 [Planctomycetota bacterium]